MHTIAGSLTRLVQLEADVRYQEPPSPGEPEFCYVPGPLPVLLSAPHGAVHTREGRSKDEDEYTAGLVRWVAERTGAHALYARRRSTGDPNWDRGVPYKRQLESAVRQGGVGFVLDLHGLAARRRFGVALGTLGGESCPQQRAAIIARLAAHGFRPDGQGLDRLNLDDKFTARGVRGQETITRYAWESLGVPAVQIELHPALRVVERRPDASLRRPFHADPAQVERTVEMLSALVTWLGEKKGRSREAPKSSQG